MYVGGVGRAGAALWAEHCVGIAKGTAAVPGAGRAAGQRFHSTFGYFGAATPTPCSARGWGDHPWRTAMWVCRELGSTVTHLGHTRNHPRPPNS